MLFAAVCPLLGSGFMPDSARAAAVSYVPGIGYDVLSHNGAVDVGGVDDRYVYARNRRVVCERAASPLAAGKADSAEAEAVVDAAVVAYVITPISIMETIVTAVESPVGRGPEGA
jgi:hypothetical protein